MHEKPITYLNLDGEQVTKTFYFNLTKAEAVELNFHKQGGLEAYARKIVEAESHGELIELFKDLILKTYGVRDGQRFRKDPELTAEFVETGAYSELFIELATNTESAIKFFREVVPPDMQSRVDETVGAPKEYTDEELLTIPWDEFYKSAGGKDDRNWDKRHLLIAFRRKQQAA